MVVGTATMAARLLGVLPGSDNSINIMLGATMAELLLLSLAIAQRVLASLYHL